MQIVQDDLTCAQQPLLIGQTGSSTDEQQLGLLQLAVHTLHAAGHGLKFVCFTSLTVTFKIKIAANFVSCSCWQVVDDV